MVYGQSGAAAAAAVALRMALGCRLVGAYADWPRTGERNEPGIPLPARGVSTKMVVSYPVLPAQAAYRSIDRANRGLTTVVIEYTLEPDTDLDVLARAVAAVGARHEALRMTVERAPGAERSGPDYWWLGFHNVVAENADVTLERAVAQGRTPRADPSRLPVFRFQTVTGEAGSALRIVTDHALCDGWSLRVLCRDIELAYERALASKERLPTESYPFSKFADGQYRRWLAGGFEDAVKTVEERICRAVPPAAQDHRRLPRWPFIKMCELQLGKESTARFEAIRTNLGSTRFVVALALFSTALNAVFDWREFVALVPNVNRPREAAGSVGPFSDSHFLVCRYSDDLRELARGIATGLAGGLRGSSPPAALVQARPAVREILAAFPRVTAEVSFEALRGLPPGRGGARVFRTRTDGDGPAEDDVIEPVPAPKFPAQPDLRLSCSFSRGHRLSVAFRVDRVPASAAASVARQMLERIRAAP
jgi:hypothetical protein